MEEIIKFEDFFEKDVNGLPAEKPINRIAFSDEDIEYKLKCIKAMQELGMVVTIDKIGNICGTFKGKDNTKSVICGSHTDSVDNGGQFDGPLGVYSALKTAENIKNSGKQPDINFKAVIYACEESTRFNGKACLGSKYLRGDSLDFKDIKSRENESLEVIVDEYKKKLLKKAKEQGLDPITEVEKVIENGEIASALEGHIEQADTLRNAGKNIGICKSIVAPYRVQTIIDDINTAAQFICKLNQKALNKEEKGENFSTFRTTVTEFSVKNKIEEENLEGKKIYTLKVNGENNHSGATPMQERKDAVYGAAKFINTLNEKSKDVVFLETCTPKWGANQITNCCYVRFAIDDNFGESSNILKIIKKQRAFLKDLEDSIKESSNSANVTFELVSNDISFKDEKKISLQKENETKKVFSSIFIDVRQQVGMDPHKAKELMQLFLFDIIHKTHGNAVLRKPTVTGLPYCTNQNLVKSAVKICENLGIPYMEMKSWAGHDLATLTNDEDAETILLFCSNSGGSHNPHETTTLDDVEKLVKVQSSLAMERLFDRDKVICSDNSAKHTDDLEPGLLEI